MEFGLGWYAFCRIFESGTRVYEAAGTRANRKESDTDAAGSTGAQGLRESFSTQRAYCT